MAKLLMRNNKLVYLNNKLVMLTAVVPPVGVSGCVGHWKFNSDLTDSSGNGYTFQGSIGGTYSFVAAKLNNGVAITVGTMYIAYNAANKFNMVSGSAISYELWYKDNGTIFLSQSIGQTDAAPVSGFYITAYTNPISVRFANASIVLSYNGHDPTTLTHIVFTYDGSSEAKLYTNGVLRDTATYSFGSPEGTLGTASAISTYDNLRIFNRVLTQTDITTLYNLGVGVEDGVTYA